MMKRVFFLLLMTTIGNTFTGDDNTNQTAAPQQMFGNILTDHVLIQNQNIRLNQNTKPHEDSDKTFVQKFSGTLADGAWQSLGAIPGLLMQVAVNAGVQLTAQQVNNWLNKPAAEDQKNIEQLMVISKLQQEMQIAGALQGTLEKLFEKHPDNDNLREALKKSQEKNTLLINKFAHLSNLYNQEGINNLTKTT